MQITEIRWATGHPGKEGPRYRMTLRPGITFIHFRPSEQSTALLCRLQSDLTRPPDDFLNDDGSPGDYWQFIFHEKDLFYSYSSDQSTREADQFFRQAIVGCEGEVLESRINYAALCNTEESPEVKRERLEQLLSRLDESRSYLYDQAGGQGKLLSLQAGIRKCSQEISRLRDCAETAPNLSEALTEAEKRLAGLKAEDQKLADEQRRIKHLMTRAEYEIYTGFRRELKETLDREGVFGSRITEKGHNITVHEMTCLTGLRKELADIEEEAGSVERKLGSVKADRIKAEQERIMAGRQLQGLNRERDQILEQVRQAEAGDRQKVISSDKGGHLFPTKTQLAWLAALLLFTAGLLLTLFARIPGLVLSGLGVLSFVATALWTFRRNLLTGIRSLSGNRRQEELSQLRSQGHQLSARIATSTINLDRLEKHILELDSKEKGLLADAARIGRKYRQTESELMRLIRQYAGPSESSEADEIITALSRQRESSAYYSEMVADLQRKMADLRHGRSEEEMEREYQHACKELGETEEGGDMAGLKDLSLEISRQRIKLAAAIEEGQETLRESKEKLKTSRESVLALGGLERKCQALSESYQSTVHDYVCIRGAIGWLKEILSQWTKIDVMAWMSLSAGYLNRLTGRRPEGQPLSLPGVTPRERIRPPRFSPARSKADQAGAAGLSAFSTAPQSARYLAIRLALIAAQIKSGWPGTPLLFFDPEIPAGRAQRENILSTLEEWSMETGLQIIYFSDDQQLVSIARAREMTIYYPG